MPLSTRCIDLLKMLGARFSRATDGNIAVIFAIVLVPILGLVGAAVDYSRMSKARSSMQAALDSAALMVSKEASSTGTMTAAQVTSKAQAYFSALYARPDIANLTVTANYDGGTTSTISMTGQGSLPTQFLSVIGFPSLTFNMASKTTWGNSALRIALVLDSTGSMADDNKMPQMKLAATNFVTQMAALARSPGDVYMSLIPFAKDVNISSLSPVGANYVDMTDYNSKNTVTSQGACDQFFLFFCIHYATVTTVKPWTGCVMDRNQNYDISNAAASSNVQALFPAENYYSTGGGSTVYFCDPTNVAAGKAYLQPVIAMTYNFPSVIAAINLMSPTGATNQAIGLAWAWQSLTQGAPMSAPAKTANVTYNEIIVLMSDGLNTQDRWYGNGSDPSPDVDTRQALLCTTLKDNAKVTIYTIQVNTSTTKPDPLSTVLQNCASKPNYFKMVTSAAAIGSAFNDISNSITKLRIAQ